MPAELQDHEIPDIGHQITKLISALMPHIDHLIMFRPHRPIQVIRQDGEKVACAHLTLGRRFVMTPHGLARLQITGISWVFTHHRICSLEPKQQTFIMSELEELKKSDYRSFGHEFAH
jgi:hypothetical protein